MRAISLFSGIEGFGLGLEQAGLQVVAQVEIDKACRDNVLARHFPDVPRWADIQELDPHELPPADLVCGGFPCQDISVAGRRAGLAGARSGLWWQFHRILAGLRPRWVVIENVPGLLSSNDGRDMGAIVGALGDLGYWWASRVLDAQHFGLAQRRRRVFIVGCLGDRAAPVQVLFEPEGGPGDPAPRRTAGQGVAASLTAGVAAARGVNAPGRRAEDDVNLVVGGSIAHTLTGRSAVEEDGTGRGVPVVVRSVAVRGREGGAQAELSDEDVANGLLAGDGGSSRQALILTVGTLQAGGNDGRGHRVGADEAAGGQLVVGALTGGVHGGVDDNDAQAGHLIAQPITAREAKGPDSEATSGNLVTHALTAEGADACEDGTGRGTPIIAVRTAQGGANGHGLADGQAHTLDGANGQAVAYALGSHAGTDGEVSNHSHANGGPVGVNVSEELAYSLRADRVQATAHAAVRRLTPTECERLQGFPDGWTAGQADSVRYRQLGNAVPVPVVRWIGERILKVDAA